MVRRFKWIGLSILVLFVVLFGLVVSPKAKALDITTSVIPDTVIKNINKIRCQINGTNITATPAGECYASNTGNLDIMNRIWNDTRVNIKKGQIFEFFIMYKQLEGLPSVEWTTQTEDYLTIVSFEKVSQEFYDLSCRRWNNANNGYSCSTISQNAWSNIYKVTVIANDDRDNVTIGLGINNGTIAIQLLTNFNVWMSDIIAYTQNDSVSQMLQDEKDENQQQGTQSNTDSDQAGQDVEGATTNLLSAITGFFGAFTSASATTCQTDWGIEGFRNFDFCGTQVPAQLQVVFTIVASIIFIPMIWFLITSILNAFKEFQQ